MTRGRMATAAALAVVALFIVFSLPSARLTTDSSWRDDSIPGIIHVHTNRSDGLSSPERIADAAARAGLRFVIFTDHGDGTRTPDAPTYRSGVLCIDAVEVSTDGGHLVALGLEQTPYPLGGLPADVVDDVHRLGGMGIAAHPDSPKAALRWSDWNTAFDGIELVNPDTSWRLRVFDPVWRSPWMITRSLFSYPFRAPETMARMLTWSPTLLERWMTTMRDEARPIVALAGIDAHAKLELKNAEPGDNRYSLPLPGYESSFRLMTVHVTPAHAIGGDAASDAKAILDAIRSGRSYTAIDAWASPPAFEFSAETESGLVREGESLHGARTATLHVRSNAPDAFETILYHGNQELARRHGERDVRVTTNDIQGVFRVEIRRPDAPDSPPWIISNPIYALSPPPHDAVPAPHLDGAATPLILSGNVNGWGTENDPTSLAAIGPVTLDSGPGALLRWGLSGGGRRNQFAGARVDMPAGTTTFTRLWMSLRSDQPMRVSVQLRAANPKQDRWKRSLYLDDVERQFVLAVDDFSPVADAPADIPALQNVLLIVDTTNTKPGASGRIWLRDVKLEGAR